VNHGNAGPRGILGIRFGPLDARRATIDPGSTLRVGRTAPAALTVPHDRRMSGVHFELRWDGARGHLRELPGAGGTWVAGRRLDEGVVAAGGWIRAGDTLFTLHAEGATVQPSAPDPPEAAAAKDVALAALQAEPDPLYAVLDAARDARVLAILRESVEEHRSLFDGARGAVLSEAAPYLVRLPSGPAGSASLLSRLVREGWGRSWGIYLTSRRPFAEVRSHLRRIQMVQMEGRPRPVYFRFYDPRALRDVMPLCTPRQAAEMFAAVRAFSLEGARGEVLRFPAR
jgi:hypothetical protein